MSVKKTHLTLTGYYAGQPICGGKRDEGEHYIHAAYSPIHKPSFRDTVCVECLKVYAESYDEDELETAPEWVMEFRKGFGLGPH